MRIVVAMSGGVDSSVAAALLNDAGHDVVGLSMQLYDQSKNGLSGSCCTLEDLHDARKHSLPTQSWKTGPQSPSSRSPPPAVKPVPQRKGISFISSSRDRHRRPAGLHTGG